MILDISLLTLVVIGVTEAIKMLVNIPKRAIPAIAIALAVFIGGMAAITGITELNWFQGIMAGLMSVGLWSGVKNSLPKKKQA